MLGAAALCVVLAACVSAPLATGLASGLGQPKKADLLGAGAGDVNELTMPAGGGLSLQILHMFQSIKLNVDVKLDNPQKAAL